MGAVVPKVKKYEGRSWPEALQKMKEDLGPGAVILYTYAPPRNGLMRILGKQRFLIVAGRNLNTIQTSASSPPPIRTRPGDTTRILRAMDQHAQPATEPMTTAEANEIKRKIEDLYHVVQRGDLPMCNEELFHAYLALVKTHVSSALARTIVARLERILSPDEASDAEALRGAIRRTIAEMIHVSGPIQLSPGRRKTIALIGPTGVGKTTTIAKLAGNFALRERRRVALVSIDTYRIAAPEQLQKVAEIMAIPMKVAGTPRELQEALHAFRAMDLVLIDTAGRSQKDEEKLGELSEYLDAAQPDEVHLVCSVTSHPENIVDTVARFGRFRIDKVILTKIDEAVKFGLVLDILARVQMSVSYVTTGQKIPFDIAEADPANLTERILGEVSP